MPFWLAKHFFILFVNSFLKSWSLNWFWVFYRGESEVDKCIFHLHVFNCSGNIKERNIYILFTSPAFTKLPMTNDRIYIISILKLEIFTFNKARKPIYNGNLLLIPLEEEAWEWKITMHGFLTRLEEAKKPGSCTIN